MIFSILLPTHNRARLLPRPIDSVLAQEWPHWELLIIDDGSTDDTREVVAAYQARDPRIRYHYQAHGERSAARNAGLALARGDYVCFLDSDDYYLPDHLSVFAEAASKREAADALLYSGLSIKVGDQLHPVRLWTPADGHPVLFFWDRGISALQFAIPKACLTQTRFPPEYAFAEDLHFLTQLALQHPLWPTGAYTVVAVEHTEQSSSARFRAEDLENIYQNNVAAKMAVAQLIRDNGRPTLDEKRIQAALNELRFTYAYGALRQGRLAFARRRLGELLRHRRPTSRYLRLVITLIARLGAQKMKAIVGGAKHTNRY